MKNTIIYGPQGSGKTRMARFLADTQYDRAFYTGSPRAHMTTMEVPKNTSVVVFDGLAECSFTPVGIQFTHKGIPLSPQPWIICCIQKSRDFKVIRTDWQYIRMPDQTVFNVEEYQIEVFQIATP